MSIVMPLSPASLNDANRASLGIMSFDNRQVCSRSGRSGLSCRTATAGSSPGRPFRSRLRVSFSCVTCTRQSIPRCADGSTYAYLRASGPVAIGAVMRAGTVGRVVTSTRARLDPAVGSSKVSVRLDSTIQIPVLEPLRVVNAALLELLDGFDADDWNRPTIHRDRNVKDLTAHLLHGSIRRVSALRDAYRPPADRSFSTAAELTQFIQEDNREFMNGMSRVSPRIICELIRRYDPELVSLFEALKPDAPGLGVVWAGEWQSQNWFDIAREYTEKWHHQQQLRDATGRPPLYNPELLVPALETFARGLPFAYRGLQAPDGVAISISVGPPADIAWTLRRTGNTWSLRSGADRNPVTSISVSADLIWRLWTKGVAPTDARGRLEITGDPTHVEPLLHFVAIMA